MDRGTSSMNFPYQKFPSTPMQPMDVDEDGKPQILDRSIGDYIRQIRSLSDEQIQRISAYQREHGLRFGESAIALKLASRDDVLWALSQQFHYPYAAREGADFNEE